MATELVKSSIDSGSGVLTLTLNRPQQRNSLSLALISALAAAFAEAAADDAVRAIVLAGNGPGFCAGHDLKELTEHRSDHDNGQAFYRDTMQQCSAMMLCIVRCPKPVIARVHGIATAAGCQLVASCDLAVASSHARFATPGVNIGLFCSTPMVALSRNVSRKHAMEMLLLGDMISAEKAAELGLDWEGEHQLLEPDLNIELGTYYLRQLADHYRGDMDLALEAYNRGPTRLARLRAGGGPGPRNYAQRVLSRREELR